jgi:hypothetical protein
MLPRTLDGLSQRPGLSQCPGFISEFLDFLKIEVFLQIFYHNSPCCSKCIYKR